MSRHPRKPSDPFPVSKICDLPGDAEALAPFYAEVDACPDALAGQHPIRRWEYAMALWAIKAWQNARVTTWTPAEVERGSPDRWEPLQICDVGGAGSHFWQVLPSVTSEDIVIVDQSLPEGYTSPGQRRLIPEPVELYASHARPSQFDLLTCISVIEHVPLVRPFLQACHVLLKPGGLFFLTTDCWDAEGPDTAHFHWMRQRIYNPPLIRHLLEGMRKVGFRSLGPADWSYAGPQVYDYSVASIAMVKL